MKATYLTLPEVSSVLEVNPALVSSWLEDGSLEARRLPRGAWGVATLALVHLLLRKGMRLPHRFEASVRALVIDDEPAMLRSTARLLKRSAPHLDVRLACGALEGLREVTEYVPDLVLVDMFMPELTGTELCVRIKQQASTAGVLVIGFSGRRDPALEAEFARAGAGAVLDKPPDVQHLLGVLERSSLECRA
ncbi:MAG TPA: response regulator [Polyangiaceae bacterium]|nr:response regulator [Polyangiaceae bacterium]